MIGGQSSKSVMQRFTIYELTGNINLTFFSIQKKTFGKPQHRPEGEVVEVLVHGVAGGASAWVRGLVDEHGVHGHDVGPREALDVVQNLHKPSPALQSALKRP